ncbi:hypothetical protein LYSBPC_35330 [Lysinibacillus piscis]|uniref:Uncharacterized protein n=1 Tax=Lysinibacillus piscis TaxID=2518931 RepID=A0ABQ5NPV2_9BACI|nr:hypothetical protein LYSBPC_35330 [Lysinibacillus sp. KH24]
MSPLTKAALVCGSGSMIILISILIHLPFAIQIILLLTGLVLSAYGGLLLVKIVMNPTTKAIPPSPVKEVPTKKKRPTSTL